jgi:hypothetical protein
MSYCRWSSSNFACDLYVYEDSGGGWTVHVAGFRIVDKVPPVIYPVDQSVEALDRFVVSHAAQMQAVMGAKHEPIGLPHDGESFYSLPTAAACADKIEELIAMGYRAPAYVVRDLREEAEP